VGAHSSQSLFLSALASSFFTLRQLSRGDTDRIKTVEQWATPAVQPGPPEQRTQGLGPLVHRVALTGSDEHYSSSDKEIA